MFKFLVALLLFFALATSAWAVVKQQETIPDASDASIVVLNEQLRQIRATLDDHENRLIAGGH
jgi:hypothetical protein